MKICGIVAEYNPFHNGHKYQIDRAREMTGCDRVIVCMSGDYVQRGLPAIVDKYRRTRAALLCGADLVIELPVLYATASAQNFAAAGVYILDALGCDYICFGSENGDINVLKDLSEAYRDIETNRADELKEMVRNGKSYPKALAGLVEGIVTYDAGEILSNDRLGVAYLRAIDKYGLDIVPITVKRTGNYLDEDIKSGSAFSIRNEIEHKNSYENIMDMMPQPSFDAIFGGGANPVFTDDFSDILYSKLLSIIGKTEDSGAVREELRSYLDVSENIAARIVREFNGYDSFSGFVRMIHSPEYTVSRIYRALIHIMLDIKSDEAYVQPDLLYARVLGINKSRADFLKEVKDVSRIPIISKAADAHNVLSEDCYKVFRRDILASELYGYVFSKKNGCANKGELSKTIIFI